MYFHCRNHTHWFNCNHSLAFHYGLQIRQIKSEMDARSIIHNTSISISIPYAINQGYPRPPRATILHCSTWYRTPSVCQFLSTHNAFTFVRMSVDARLVHLRLYRAAAAAAAMAQVVAWWYWLRPLCMEKHLASETKYSFDIYWVINDVAYIHSILSWTWNQWKYSYSYF